jgi:hypothetical protein
LDALRNEVKRRLSLSVENTPVVLSRTVWQCAVPFQITVDRQLSRELPIQAEDFLNAGIAQHEGRIIRRHASPLPHDCPSELLRIDADDALDFAAGGVQAIERGDRHIRVEKWTYCPSPDQFG